MARGSSKALNTSNKICPANKFSFLNGCTSWSSVLSIFTLLALLLIFVLIALNKKKLTSSGKNILETDISMNSQNLQSKKISLSRNKPLYEPLDPMDDGHNNTGTPTSERIKYDINVNIRDATSYAQNPNLLSYGRYEAEKNIERIVNPILPPERSYVNTYGIPINIPSRGPQQSYQQVGILYKENIENQDKLPGNNNESNILPLFGRPTYSGSNRWNYYTSSDKFQTVKLPINIDGRKCTDELGCNELMNGDMITIPSYNGKFKVEIYDFDRPRYIPFVY
jgi:hypothetical protein